MSEDTIPQVIPIPNRNVKDITGQKFGRLTVVGYIGSVKVGAHDSSYAQWLCTCECGSQMVTYGANLRSGNTKSCGCLHLENIASVGRSTRKHGRHTTAEYHIWQSMKARCAYPKYASYARYGGRGIKVCERWHRFEEFFADMGARPTSAHSLDRIDNDGDYCPENCRWATPTEQANNREKTLVVAFNGVTRTLAEWSGITGISSNALRVRIFKYGWDIERALTTPTR